MYSTNLIDAIVDGYKLAKTEIFEALEDRGINLQKLLKDDPVLNPGVDSDDIRRIHDRYEEDVQSEAEDYLYGHGYVISQEDHDEEVAVLKEAIDERVLKYQAFLRELGVDIRMLELYTGPPCDMVKKLVP